MRRCGYVGNISLPNNICTALGPDPDLMYLACIDVPSLAHAEGLPGRVVVLGVRNGQLTLEDEVRCHACMRVRWVVGIGAVGPRKDVIKAPGPDLILVIAPCLLVGHAGRAGVGWGVLETGMDLWSSRCQERG